MVRFVVLQESRITASATVPPTPHKIFSRLPWVHRVSLERHTNGEYGQKDKTLTTHFFGKNGGTSSRQNPQFSDVCWALNRLRDMRWEISRRTS